jgi:hypothetical protein
MMRFPAVTGALALLVGLAAGCFRVESPAEYACSRAEEACPEGLVCNGERCVRPGSDARAERSTGDGASRTDMTSGADAPAGCGVWQTGWKCNSDIVAGTAAATCGNRTISCTDASHPGCSDPAWGCWRCTCQTPSGTATCSGTSDLWFGCDAAKELFDKGCCKP